MTCEKFEITIAHHCSPVLMGQKPSNLVSFSKEKAPNIPELTELYTEKFRDEGICMEIICGCRQRYLVMIYRPDMLEEYLASPEARAVLKKDGYAENAGLDELLGHLKRRFESDGEFPHEIGLFLGYPLEDVQGFQQNKGKDCKMCGYWKVYGDVEAARRTFARFDRCREFTGRKLRAGYTISQVVRMKQLCIV